MKRVEGYRKQVFVVYTAAAFLTGGAAVASHFNLNEKVQ